MIIKSDVRQLISNFCKVHSFDYVSPLDLRNGVYATRITKKTDSINIELIEQKDITNKGLWQRYWNIHKDSNNYYYTTTKHFDYYYTSI